MSENDKQEELPYVEPNSGAAPQPGGFVAYGESSVMPEPAGSDTPAAPDNDPEFEAKQGEASQAVEGDNPNADGQQGDTESETPASPAAEQEQGTPDGEPASAPEAKDYSELLDRNVPDVQKYMDANPDEADAIKAAEAEGKKRAGILEH